MTGFVFSDEAVPFPPENGIYVRLIVDNDAHIVGGNVLIFDGPEVFDLGARSTTTPEVLMEGDRKTQAMKCLVSYTKIKGISGGKKLAEHVANNRIRNPVAPKPQTSPSGPSTTPNPQTPPPSDN